MTLDKVEHQTTAHRGTGTNTRRSFLATES